MLNMQKEFNAILVNVEVPDQTICFIAMPFDEEFNTLAGEITRTVNGLGPKPIFLKDINEKKFTFLTDIYEAIRSAKLVIGVITPSKNKQDPNTNVMYELGLAHSLGKSTIILTNSTNGLPSDLQGVSVLRYSPDEIPSEAFRDKLSKEINVRLRRMDENNNVLTDPLHKDISVAYARHRLFLDPLFWDHFKNILRFGKLVHKEFQAIEDSYIAFLLKLSEDICGSDEIERKKVIEFNRKWTNFSIHYSSMTRTQIFDNLSEFKENIPKSFSQIKQNAGAAEIESITRILEGFYEDIIKHLDSFHDDFEKIEEQSGGDFLTILKGSESSQDLYHKIFSISQVVEHVTLQADALLQNLINLIF